MSVQNNRKLIIGIGIIISFALLMFSISMYFNLQHEERSDGRISPELIDQMDDEELKQYLEQRYSVQATFHSFYLIPFIAFIGVIVGLLVYYIMADKIVQKETSLEKNTKIILNFLTGQERKVIETLMENEGKVQQYELSHLPNLNKVKTHRILQNLEQKGIIHKEKIGKINKIVLDKELYKVLKE